MNFYLFGVHMSGIKMVVQYSDHHLNNGPFGDLTTFNHSNTQLVRYSDPNCTFYIPKRSEVYPQWRENIKIVKIYFLFASNWMGIKAI